VYSALRARLSSGKVRHGAALLGAFLGLVADAAYDLTNWATVRDWPLPVILVDLAWGTVLTAGVSSIGYLAANWLR
jgi:uncharacterized membrane protein